MHAAQPGIEQRRRLGACRQFGVARPINGGIRRLVEEAVLELGRVMDVVHAPQGVPSPMRRDRTDASGMPGTARAAQGRAGPGRRK